MLRQIADRRRRNPPPWIRKSLTTVDATAESTTAESKSQAGAENSSLGGDHLRMRASQVRLKLLRRREETLLAGGRSDVMQLLLAQPLLFPTNPSSPPSSVLESGSDGVIWRGWASVSSVLREDGDLLCIEHSLEGLSKSMALVLGRLVPGKSRFQLMTAEELAMVGAVGGRRLWGCKLVVFSSPMGELWEGTIAASAGAGESGAGSRLVILASADVGEFQQLRREVLLWLRPATSAGTAVSAPTAAAASSGLRPLFPPPSGPASAETHISIDHIDCATAGQTGPLQARSEEVALECEVERLHNEVTRLRAENRQMWCGIVRAELRLRQYPQPVARDSGIRDETVCSKGEPGWCSPVETLISEEQGKLQQYMVPRVQLEEAYTFAALLDEEAKRLQDGMRTALSLLDTLCSGMPPALPDQLGKSTPQKEATLSSGLSLSLPDQLGKSTPQKETTLSSRLSLSLSDKLGKSSPQKETTLSSKLPVAFPGEETVCKVGLEWDGDSGAGVCRVEETKDSEANEETVGFLQNSRLSHGLAPMVSQRCSLDGGPALFCNDEPASDIEIQFF